MDNTNHLRWNCAAVIMSSIVGLSFAQNCQLYRQGGIFLLGFISQRFSGRRRISFWVYQGFGKGIFLIQLQSELDFAELALFQVSVSQFAKGVKF